MELDPLIRGYYQRGGELDRLDVGHGILEKVRTQDILTRLLPAPPASVLDVGGGTGVYAGWLAERGHAVRVIDPVPLHVQHAATVPGVTADLGDARDLHAADDSYDVTLLLGPLYHLTEREERLSALREAARVTRPGGLVVAATINRYAALYDTLARGLYLDPQVQERTDSAVVTGTHRPDGLDGLFTVAYFHHPDQILDEFAAAGLPGAIRYAVEGAGTLLGNYAELMRDQESTAAVVHALRTVEQEPSLLGISAHLLTCARVT